MNLTIEMGTSLLPAVRSHEAEDASDVPSLYNDTNLLMTSPDIPREKRPQIFMALTVSRSQGRRDLHVTCLEDARMMNIDERRRSFTEDPNITWVGPSPAHMAKAGWFCLSDNRASCPFCKVTTREWTAEDDPWRRHKEFSPRCRYLRQAGDQGIAPSPDGKKMLRHSWSSLYDLNRPSR